MMNDLEARLAIVSLDSMGPVRARWLLSADLDREPELVAPYAVERLRTGRLPDAEPAPAGVTPKLIEKWQRALRKWEPAHELAKHDELGIKFLRPLDPEWPFEEEPDPPLLIFYAGDLGLLERPVSVAVVGTRRCTTVGRTVAFNFGRDLAAADVTVVSGLALGVDGAAHRGALDAGGPVIGVVGSGIDVVYPGANRPLWNEVAASGLLLSEAPAGERPKRWRFPARNRLIAFLGQGLVVVESHQAGGALLTVDEAVDRGRPVFAVPGSVLSPASDGTNGLLIDGATPVRDAADVLHGLGITDYVPIEQRASSPVEPSAGEATVFNLTTGLSGHDSALIDLVLREVAAGPVHLDQLVLASNKPPSEVLAAVQAMVANGDLDLDGSTVSRP